MVADAWGVGTLRASAAPICQRTGPCTPARRRCHKRHTTVTVRLSGRTKDRLGELAGRTRRARSVLAEEAIAAYVERELATINEIERAWAEGRGGAVVAWRTTR